MHGYRYSKRSDEPPYGRRLRRTGYGSEPRTELRPPIYRTAEDSESAMYSGWRSQRSRLPRKSPDRVLENSSISFAARDTRGSRDSEWSTSRADGPRRRTHSKTRPVPIWSTKPAKPRERISTARLLVSWPD